MSGVKIQPFDSFSVVYKVLVWAGYFKLLKKSKNRVKWICHQMYRVLAFFVAVVYNLQHITFIIQVSKISRAYCTYQYNLIIVLLQYHITLTTQLIIMKFANML